MRPILFLDISRLVRRYENLGGPTGMDRVEMAYADWAAITSAFDARYVTRWRGGLVMLSPSAVRRVVDTLKARWSAPAPPQSHVYHARSTRSKVTGRLSLWSLIGAAKPLDAGGAPSVTLNVGHEGLDHPDRYAGLPGAFAVLLSDLIPITHPEYETPRASALHRMRLETLRRHADHVFTNSEATRRALLANHSDAPYTTSAALLGPALPDLAVAPADEPPARHTFVHLSSLDRRKNVALLLHLWREFAWLADPPGLTLIGRIGNDASAAALLTRCEALTDTVRHLGPVSDEEALRHLSDARALLSPSFVEGFGLPLAEARRLGVPIIASDIAAHREVAGDGAVLLHPLDGVGWRDAILRLARDDVHHAGLRDAITPPPQWPAHFAHVETRLLALAR